MNKPLKSILLGTFLLASFQSFSQSKVSLWNVEFLAINSLGDDFCPTFYKKGLIFTSNRNPGFAFKWIDETHQKPFTSLYQVDSFSNLQSIIPEHFRFKEDTVIAQNYNRSSVSDSKVLGQFVSQKKTDSLAIKSRKVAGVKLASQFLQTKYHDGPAFFSAITQDFYVTRSNYYQGKEKRGSNGKNNLQIYIIRDTGGQSFNVRKFEHNSDDYSNMHPTLSTDGNIMIFASDREGGFGGLDLYYSLKQDTTWSKPTNMGSKINTAKDDSFPFIDELGNLYFSSNGREGAGNLDVYFVKLNKTEVLELPENLGFAVNTPYDDFGFIIRDGIGFVSSDRLGNDDIYRVKNKINR